LALHVIEKPTPRVWMIFIPIFFVFYFWKLKEYEKGLKTFAENHLLSRCRTLENAVVAEKSGQPVDIQALVDQVEELQENTRAFYAEWLTVLAGHYRLLLNAKGDSYPALVRSGYRNKSNYLLFCRQLGKVESAFNMAILPTIDGERGELHFVTETMTEGLSNQRLREAEEIFS
jgi:hypothetical protein